MNFRRDDVLKVLGTPDTEKSTKTDELEQKILKQIILFITVPLITILNMLLGQGELPVY